MFKYDAELMHNGEMDEEAKRWFIEQILLGEELHVFSPEIGDEIGTLSIRSVEVKMWRPDDWNNGWDKQREEDGMASKAEIFEAGADAMLEVLILKLKLREIDEILAELPDDDTD